MKDASSEAKNNTAAADEKGHARVPAAVIVYLTPMTGNLPESPGSQRSLETANSVVPQCKPAIIGHITTQGVVIG